MTKKTFIVDTNVLLADPEALYSFEDNNIIIPLMVIEELDNHKSRQDEVGRNARETVRKIMGLMQDAQSLKDGIILSTGGLLKILSVDDFAVNLATKNLPSELLKKETADNSIIGVCHKYIKAHPQESVTMVSKDSLVRIKCNALGIECEDYEKVPTQDSLSKLYSGAQTLEIDYDIAEFQAEKTLYLSDDELETIHLHPNECVVLVNKSDKKSTIARFTSLDAPLRLIEEGVKAGKLEPRNKEQKFALDLLADPKVKLVTLAGLAGCGKTLLSIAVGLEEVLVKKRYKSLIVCRPIQPVGRDIGFLPGTIEEKMEPWIAPIKDNLRFLISNSGKRSKNVEETLKMYFEEGTIEVEAMTFIRGRSISNAFMIIDEAQNLNVHELKTILTRVGEGTKIILTGDIEQIDNTNVDSLSNGLTIAIEKFKDEAIAGHVTLTKGERSELATMAAKKL